MQIGSIAISFFYKNTGHSASKTTKAVGIVVVIKRGERLKRYIRGIILAVDSGHGRIGYISRKQTLLKTRDLWEK